MRSTSLAVECLQTFLLDICYWENWAFWLVSTHTLVSVRFSHHYIVDVSPALTYDLCPAYPEKDKEWFHKPDFRHRMSWLSLSPVNISFTFSLVSMKISNFEIYQNVDTFLQFAALKKSFLDFPDFWPQFPDLADTL